MTELAPNVRSARGEWRPEGPIALAPINAWPPRPAATARWLFGFPGYLWPYNALWLAIALLTWTFLTPELGAMASFEAWWVGLLLARNLVFVLVSARPQGTGRFAEVHQPAFRHRHPPLRLP